MAYTELEFETIFKSHYQRLHRYAITILKDADDAEELVQDTFADLWEKKETIPEVQSMAAYLCRAVHNRCLNHLKHEKVKNKYERYALHTGTEVDNYAAPNKTHQMEHRLRQALEQLPEQCRTVFQLSRFEDLKYREIAAYMGLSVKTVEHHMGKALKIMRVSLADLLPLLLIILESI